MREINYITINEEVGKYLSYIENTFLYRNLPLFFQKTNQIVEQCDLLEEPIPDRENKLDLIEGLNEVESYLKGIDPDLGTDFWQKINNGVIELRLDEEEENRSYGCWCHTASENIERKEEGKEMTVSEVPKFLIDIDQSPVNYEMLASLVHEYFHSIYNTKKPTEESLTFRELPSIFYELDFLKEHQEEDSQGLKDALLMRYNDTIRTARSHLDHFVLLAKKKDEGVLDEHSYKIGKIRCPEKRWESTIEKINQEIIDKKKSPNPERTSVYLLAAPLAYHLIEQEDPTMKHKMYQFIDKIHQDPPYESLSVLGFRAGTIENLDFGKEMNDMKKEVEILSQKEKTSAHNK